MSVHVNIPPREDNCWVESFPVKLLLSICVVANWFIKVTCTAVAQPLPSHSVYLGNLTHVIRMMSSRLPSCPTHTKLPRTSYPDDGYRNHTKFAHSYCYELWAVPRQLYNWVLRWPPRGPHANEKFIKMWGEPHKITWEIRELNYNGVQWTHPHVFDRIQLRKLYGQQNRTRRHYTTPGSTVGCGERTQTRTFWKSYSLTWQTAWPQYIPEDDFQSTIIAKVALS